MLRLPRFQVAFAGVSHMGPPGGSTRMTSAPDRPAACRRVAPRRTGQNRSLGLPRVHWTSRTSVSFTSPRPAPHGSPSSPEQLQFRLRRRLGSVSTMASSRASSLGVPPIPTFPFAGGRGLIALPIAVDILGQKIRWPGSFLSRSSPAMGLGALAAVPISSLTAWRA
jgi:hypothetical protein